MNKLYKAIYNYLKGQYIDINSISKIEGLFENENDKDKEKAKEKENNKKNSHIIHPIFNIIKDNLFLHPYKKINDILIYLNKEKKKDYYKKCHSCNNIRNKSFTISRYWFLLYNRKKFKKRAGTIISF
jgi:hypothetical protein